MVRKRTDLVLPAHFTVNEVGSVKEAMSKFLQKAGPEIKCNGSEINIIDGTALQLILAFYKTTRTLGKNFTLINPSSELQEVLTNSGVDKVLTVEEVD